MTATEPARPGKDEASWIARLALTRSGIRRRTAVGLVSLLLLCLPVPAVAGEVYGTITVDGKVFSGNLTLTDGAKQVPIREGKYRVFLSPGRHTVILSDGQRQWREEVQSYPGPLRQDINLRRR